LYQHTNIGVVTEENPDLKRPLGEWPEEV